MPTEGSFIKSSASPALLYFRHWRDSEGVREIPSPFRMGTRQKHVGALVLWCFVRLWFVSFWFGVVGWVGFLVWCFFLGGDVWWCCFPLGWENQTCQKQRSKIAMTPVYKLWHSAWLQGKFFYPYLCLCLFRNTHWPCTKRLLDLNLP